MTWLDEHINTVIQGDCLQVLKNIPDESIDMVITSPPYNLGNNHHTSNKNTQAYEDDLPENDYRFIQQSVLKELYRITKNEGSLFYNHKNRIKNGQSITPYYWILKTQWIVKQEIIWWNGSPCFDPIRFYAQTERIYWLAKSYKTVLKNNIKATDVWSISPVGSNGEHTRQFPADIPTRILNCFENTKLVLDPYAGGGTVAIVAERLGINWIGIEINEKYCEIARARIKKEQDQIKLF